jgi:hypothetical protein
VGRLAEDDTPWTWERRVSDIDGSAYYAGTHPYRSATVTRSTCGWQARIPALGAELDQRSPYYASPASARAWAERYGKPRTRGKRKR